MTVTREPVAYQRAVYQELREVAADFFDGDWHSLVLEPRTNVLVVGASGGGKTFLSQHLATERKLPILSLEYGSWVVCGASSRGAIHTLRLLYRFVQDHPRGIIALDEIDKLGVDATSDWTRSVHLEIFSILDKRVLSGVLEEAVDDEMPKFLMTGDEIKTRLVRGYLIVGSGAWQHLWRTRAAAGFRQVSDGSALPTYDNLANCLRPEILNRFRTQPLFLPPLSRGDYLALLDEILHRLPHGFRKTMTTAALASVEQAVETQKGFRWVEELLSVAVRDARRAKSLLLPDAEEPRL